MKNNYQKKSKKHLSYLIVLAIMFSFSKNSVAQLCGTVAIQNQLNVSCYAMNGVPPSPNAPDGSINVTGIGGTGFYHYWLEVFVPPNAWGPAGQTPAPGVYTSNSVNFINMDVDSFRVRIVEGLTPSGPAISCADTIYLTITEPTAVVFANPSSIIIGGVSTPTSSNGSISGVNGADGTPGTVTPYTYLWTAPTNIPQGIVPAGQSANNSLTGLVAGLYKVVVTDANGCEKDTTLEVSVAPCGMVLDTTGHVLCYGDSSGLISVKDAWGTPPFIYSIKDIATGLYVFTSSSTNLANFLFDSIPADVYRIKITDNVGCIDSINPDISITEPPAALTVNINTIIDASTVLACDGSIIAQAAGGVGVPSYEWINLATMAQVATSNLAVGLCGPEEYCVTVTDGNLCTAEACDSVRLVVPCQNPFSLTPINNFTIPATCRGGDGSLQITPDASGTPFFQYSIDGSPFDTIWNQDTLIGGLLSGSYIVEVFDSSGNCSATDTFTIEVTPNPIITSVTVINESCCGGDGQIIVFTNNNLAIASYSIDTLLPQNTSDFDSLYTGDYLVHVEDINFCKDSIQVFIGKDTVPNINMIAEVSDIVCYGDTNGTFKVDFPDSCYNYVLWRYTLFNPQVVIDTGSYFNELIIGYYGVVATSKSGECVDSTARFYIGGPDLIEYNKPISSAVYCMNPGTCNGSISLDGLVTGGTPPYHYSVQEVYTNIPSDTIGVDSTFFGLCSGVYDVKVQDASACVIRDTITVLDSSLYIDSFVVENSSCFGYNDGEITVYAHGGVPPYTYQWSNGDITQTADSLSPDDYYVTVKDASSSSCYALGMRSTVQPDTLRFKIIETGKIDETCMGVSNDGQIFLEMTGGTAPYNYSWWSRFDSLNTGSGFGDIMTGLTYDTITISVSDTNGCLSSPTWATVDFTVVDALNAYNPLMFDTVLIGNSPMCFGSTNGTIQIDIQGEAPYLYSIDNGVTQSLADTFFNLIGDSSYNIVVYDAFGCTDSASVFLEEYAELIINVDSIEHVNCYDDSTGKIWVSASGGIGDFSYFWLPTFDTTAMIDTLVAAPYMVQVTDSVGCTAVLDSIIVKHLTDPIQSLNLTVNHIKCFGAQEGSASIEYIGGMPSEDGYFVSWMNLLVDTVPSVYLVDSLLSGVYYVTVTDSFDCGPITDTIIITEPSEFYLDTFYIKHNLCDGDEDGTINIVPLGGVAPYTNYIIDSNGVMASQLNSALFTDLIEGLYSWWSIDTNGCKSDTVIEEKLGTPGLILFDAKNIDVTDLSCFQSDDGIIKLSVSSGTPPYQYQLQDGSTVLEKGNADQAIIFSIYDLAASGFTIYISDYNDCKIDTQIVVSQPDEVVAKFEVDNDLGRKGFTALFENLSLGADAFVWDFSDGALEDKEYDDEVVHTFDSQGEYVVYLIAHNSNLPHLCDDTDSLTIQVDGYDVSNVFSPNNDDINDVFSFDDWMFKEIDVEIFSRWGKQVYHWSGAGGYWDGRNYNNETLPEGVYFYIMNAQGMDGHSFQEKGSVTLFR